MTLHWRRRVGPRRDVTLLWARNDARTLRALAPWLRGADHFNAQSRKRKDRRRELLIGRALLRLVATDRRRTSARRVRLRLWARRRPLDLSGDRRHRALSLSHASGWVIAAAAEGGASGRVLGIDIEARDRPLSGRIAARVPHGGQPTIRDWCRVEAALKADARGMSALALLKPAGPMGNSLARVRMADRTPGVISTRRVAALPRSVVGQFATGSRLGRPSDRPLRSGAQPVAEQHDQLI